MLMMFFILIIDIFDTQNQIYRQILLLTDLLTDFFFRVFINLIYEYEETPHTHRTHPNMPQGWENLGYDSLADAMTTLGLQRTISSESEMSEDLALTPTPRSQDWSLLPNDIIMRIIRVSTDNGRLTTLKYWEEQVARRMKPFDVLSEWNREPKMKNVSMTEFHMNKVRTIKVIGEFQAVWGSAADWFEPNQGLRDLRFRMQAGGPTTTDALWRNLKFAPAYKVKVKVDGKRKCRCSICGKLGHNKSNSKFH